jgi:hypothetical protein
MSVVRVAAVLLLITVSLAACGSTHRTAAPSGHRTTAPPTLHSVRAYLAGSASLSLQRLPKSAAVPVDAQRAEDVVLDRMGKKLAPKNVSATLVRATDSGWCNEQPDGACRKVIKNRHVWIVLVSTRQVTVIYPYGKTGPPSYWATVATLVDARSGKYLMAAAIPTV